MPQNKTITTSTIGKRPSKCAALIRPDAEKLSLLSNSNSSACATLRRSSSTPNTSTTGNNKRVSKSSAVHPDSDSDSDHMSIHHATLRHPTTPPTSILKFAIPIPLFIALLYLIGSLLFVAASIISCWTFNPLREEGQVGYIITLSTNISFIIGSVCFTVAIGIEWIGLFFRHKDQCQNESEKGKSLDTVTDVEHGDGYPTLKKAWNSSGSVGQIASQLTTTKSTTFQIPLPKRLSAHLYFFGIFFFDLQSAAGFFPPSLEVEINVSKYLIYVPALIGSVCFLLGGIISLMLSRTITDSVVNVSYVLGSMLFVVGSLPGVLDSVVVHFKVGVWSVGVVWVVGSGFYFLGSAGMVWGCLVSGGVG